MEILRWKKEKSRKIGQEKGIFYQSRFYQNLSGSSQSHNLLILGSSGVRRAWAGDSIPHVEAVDGLHGDPAQERDWREAPIQVRDAFYRRRRRSHILYKFPRRGSIRSRRLHQRIHSLTHRSARRHWRKASTHALLQVSHQFQQEELRVTSSVFVEVQLHPKISTLVVNGDY